jgi:hypothetical protein
MLLGECPCFERLVGLKPGFSAQQEAHRVSGGIVRECDEIMSALASGRACWPPHISVYLITEILGQWTDANGRNGQTSCTHVQARVAGGFLQCRVRFDTCNRPAFNELAHAANSDVSHAAMQPYKGDDLDCVGRLRHVYDAVQFIRCAYDLAHLVAIWVAYLKTSASDNHAVSFCVEVSKRHQCIGDRRCMQGFSEDDLQFRISVRHSNDKGAKSDGLEALLVCSVEEDRWRQRCVACEIDFIGRNMTSSSRVIQFDLFSIIFVSSGNSGCGGLPFLTQPVFETVVTQPIHGGIPSEVNRYAFIYRPLSHSQKRVWIRADKLRMVLYLFSHPEAVSLQVVEGYSIF